MKLTVFRPARLRLGAAIVKLDRSGICRKTLTKVITSLGANIPIFFFHSASIYDFKTNNLANFCGEDLFNVILGMDRVIVDSCVEWKKRSLKQPHKAFILGRTISHEAHNLDGVFFNDKVRGGRQNVFVLGISDVNGIPVIEIHRLDSHFKSVFRRQLPTLDEMGPTERARWNDPIKRRRLRDCIAEIVEVFPADLLRAKIAATTPFAFKNFPASCEVAEWAYALLLQETGYKDKKEVKKFIENDDHLFGDTQLIQEAIFFNAGILSENREHVWRMASYCGINVEK